MWGQGVVLGDALPQCPAGFQNYGNIIITIIISLLDWVSVGLLGFKKNHKKRIIQLYTWTFSLRWMSYSFVGYCWIRRKAILTSASSNPDSYETRTCSKTTWQGMKTLSDVRIRIRSDRLEGEGCGRGDGSSVFWEFWEFSVFRVLPRYPWAR